MKTTLERPADSAGALYRRTDVSPEQIFQAIGRLRKEARDEIDRLIRFLDETDQHIEREPEDEGDDGEEEPSLGSFDRMTDQSKAWRQAFYAVYSGVDAEQDGADDEPSLGSIEDHPNGYLDASDWNGQGRSQANWASGNRDDLEGDEHDGAEPGEDGEPSLGAFEGHDDQTVSWTTDALQSYLDKELDPSDSGIGDHDGLLEQVGWEDNQFTVMA